MARERKNRQLCLKPQDVLLALKLCSDSEMEGAPYAALAASVGLTTSETHGGIHRAAIAGLVRVDKVGRHPARKAILEFLLHGVRYAYPAERGRLVRGMATSYGPPPLNEFILPGAEPPPVWPDARGNARGPRLWPLYPSVPLAAGNDDRLYRLLALVDAMREGRVREREIAARNLQELLA